MPLLQYLISCEDGSMCIVHRTSISGNERRKLTEGQKVSFMWPEDESSSSRKEYRGEIIQSSTNESILQIVKQRKIKEIEAEMKKKERLEKDAMAKLRKEKNKPTKESKKKGGKNQEEMSDKKNFPLPEDDTKKNHKDTREKKKHRNDEDASSSRKRKTDDKHLPKTISPVSAKRKCDINMAKSLFKELDKIDDDGNEVKPSILRNQHEKNARENTEDLIIGISEDENHSGSKQKLTSGKTVAVLPSVREEKSNVDIFKELRSTLSKAQELVDLVLFKNASDDEENAIASRCRSVEDVGMNFDSDENDEIEQLSKLYSPRSNMTRDSRSLSSFPIMPSNFSRKFSLTCPSHSPTPAARAHQKTSNIPKSPVPAKSRSPSPSARTHKNITNIPKTAVAGRSRSPSSPPLKSVALYSELLDEENSSWTLRFTKEEENKIIELMPGTGIYVSKAELSVINRNAKDQTQMARQLLDAIFTREALKTCSLCGKKPKGLGKGDNPARPGLNQEARTVLIEYVQETAAKMRWPAIADQLIMQSLRGKLNEIKDTAKLNKK